ncbi:MAG: hypothetical protein KDC38_10050 [Planctomycetes bacterium]|nr:hypothetical protein [Planctomycetota bacterium]
MTDDSLSREAILESLRVAAGLTRMLLRLDLSARAVDIVVEIDRAIREIESELRLSQTD